MTKTNRHQVIKEFLDSRCSYRWYERKVDQADNGKPTFTNDILTQKILTEILKELQFLNDLLLTKSRK